MKYKFLLILFFFSTAALAQIQSQKGSITLSNGTAVSGAVTYYYDNPKEIILYAENGSKIIFTPEEVQQILLANGEKFIVRTYAVNQDSSKIILQSLIESPGISLFAREDNANVSYYVSKDGNLYRLENNYVVTREGAKTFRRDDNKYIATLSTIMADRFDIIERLNKISLTEGDLTKVIVDYNKGDLSYYWKSNIETAKESNWVFFAQFSRYASFADEDISDFSTRQLAGVQYYFPKHYRHSLKFSLERAYYISHYERLNILGLGVRYQYDFKKSEKYGFYLMMQLAEIDYVRTKSEKPNVEDANRVGFYPRLSPGVGFEAKTSQKVAFYAEINHMLHFMQLPHSFSLGIKYDFGNTTW